MLEKRKIYTFEKFVNEEYAQDMRSYATSLPKSKRFPEKEYAQDTMSYDTQILKDVELDAQKKLEPFYLAVKKIGSVKNITNILKIDK